MAVDTFVTWGILELLFLISLNSSDNNFQNKYN